MLARSAIDEPRVLRRVSVAEADAEIRRGLEPFPDEIVSLQRAHGRVLREPVRADRDLPPFDRATMDGIAIRCADWQAGCVEFQVVGVQAAGRPPLERSGEAQCFEIMTGAVLPHGCDCVVPVEQIDVADGRATLAASAAPEPQQFVHGRATDHARGSVLLEPGARLRAPEIAVLAAIGCAHVCVAARPAVAVVATGDELVEVDAPVEAHQVRRSNDRALAAGLASHGYENVTRAHAPDDRETLRLLLGELLESHAALVLSGGVSAGRYDHVPAVLADLGVTPRFHAVRQRPGKPLWFGIAAGGRMVFALPGNPVSALVCLHRYVLPALECAEGAQDRAPETVALADEVEFEPELTWFLPVRLQEANEGWRAVPVSTNTSGDFAALTRSDGFVELAAEQRRFPVGFAAPLYRW